MLAQLGYIAMAVDMYGDGKIATTPQEAQQLAGALYKDPQLANVRIEAAVKELLSFPEADPTKLAAIGYCFGGSMTYSWNSGRPYNDPNANQFMAAKAPDYSDLSLSVTYLTNLWGRFTVIYASVSNLLNRSQVYTYRYYNAPNSQGVYPHMSL